MSGTLDVGTNFGSGYQLRIWVPPLNMVTNFGSGYQLLKQFRRLRTYHRLGEGRKLLRGHCLTIPRTLHRHTVHHAVCLRWEGHVNSKRRCLLWISLRLHVVMAFYSNPMKNPSIHFVYTPHSYVFKCLSILQLFTLIFLFLRSFSLIGFYCTINN